MQEAVAHLGNQMSAIMSDATDGFSYPGGISTEQLIIGGGPEESDYAELHDEMIYQLLDFCFTETAFLQIFLCVDV